MKKSLFIISAFLLSSLLFAQKSPYNFIGRFYTDQELSALPVPDKFFDCYDDLYLESILSNEGKSEINLDSELPLQYIHGTTEVLPNGKPAIHLFMDPHARFSHGKSTVIRTQLCTRKRFKVNQKASQEFTFCFNNPEDKKCFNNLAALGFSCPSKYLTFASIQILNGRIKAHFSDFAKDPSVTSENISGKNSVNVKDEVLGFYEYGTEGKVKVEYDNRTIRLTYNGKTSEYTLDPRLDDDINVHFRFGLRTSSSGSDGFYEEYITDLKINYPQ